MFETEILLKETKWFHIAVVWDSNMSSLTVYINGEMTMEQTISLPTFTFGDVFVNSSGTEGNHAILSYILGKTVMPTRALCYYLKLIVVH